MSRKDKVLIVASHFTPNVGGVETHLSGLVEALIRRKWEVIVSTYVPLARSVRVSLFEKRRNLRIYRMPWIGFNIVHKLTPYPFLEFLYLSPGLFLITSLALLLNPDITVLHAQGLVPAVVALILARLTGKKIIMSTHNLYFFPKSGLYTSFTRLVLSSVDKVLCLSDQSLEEIAEIGVPREKLKPFRYWLNLHLFKPLNKKSAKDKTGLSGKFVAFFLGRLIETKGAKVILNASKITSGITYVFAGLGPLAREVEKMQKRNKNIIFLGPVSPEKVRLYMNATDVVVVPSLVDEGYGRVAMEAIACGTPVLSAKRGGLSEVVNPKVGVLIEPTAEQYGKWLMYFKRNQKKLVYLGRNTRGYALVNFSEKNVEKIIESYKE